MLPSDSNEEKKKIYHDTHTHARAMGEKKRVNEAKQNWRETKAHKAI